MRRISLQFAALLSMLFLFSFSCEDHVVPETPEILPVVSTRPMQVSGTGKLHFKMAFENLGNVQIASYGIVYSVGFFDLNINSTKIPTINFIKQDFLGDPGLGELSHSEAAAPEGFYAIYYRAFAMLGSGEVVYGNTMEFNPDLGGRAVLEVFGTPNINMPYNTGYVFKNLGNKNIVEYGLVYSYNTAVTQAINPMPTVADHKRATNAQTSPPVKDLIRGVNLQIAESAINELYVRSYVIYADQTVDYGKFTAHIKK
ncbi:hypothetical protein [Dyadobacter aurulentus]|uniref:hypothetical protein n=1 Tax=Dyadobacter sp. UC 10 TaxID=2605428 RepID=UPI0011F3F127|nr:hypothetical protein [Dyadobacter sp. UC 10]KAA0993052.1 hypothetical protein FXO21_24210 [Dyadobacter sp. UC 10]